jgi:hypothetical protein
LRGRVREGAQGKIPTAAGYVAPLIAGAENDLNVAARDAARA